MRYNVPTMQNAFTWVPALIRRELRLLLSRNRDQRGLVHVLFCLADHFEPMWNNAEANLQRQRVQRWVNGYPKLALAHKDSNGRPPVHTWFYAAEQYNAYHMEKLSGLCSSGLGEIEVHLHHENDTPEGLKEKLEKAKYDFSRHGALITREGQRMFAFIHGDFALNNSGASPQLCGVNNELRILRQAGCFADFTLPSAPHETQTRKVNSIYYAKDTRGMRKSHDRGVDVRVGGEKTGDLMLIQGPLALNWRRRKGGILPRIENGCILNSNPGTPHRVDLWVKQHIHVLGRPDWIFVKVHCHGAQEDDIYALLGGGAHRMFQYLEDRYNDGRQYRLHYVTAREMYNIVRAAEDRCKGDPFLYRDYVVLPYLNSGEGNTSEKKTIERSGGAHRDGQLHRI